MSHRPTFSHKRVNRRRSVNLRTGVVDSLVNNYSEGLTTVGTDNKEFRRLIAKRLDASTSYSTVWLDPPKYLYSRSSCQIREYDSTVYPPILYWSDLVGEVSTLGANALIQQTPDYSDIDDIALKRLKNRLANDTKQFQLSVPVAEIKELRGLVKQTASLATDVVKLMLELKHGRVRDAYRIASDLWLGFSFGVKPLIGDTKAAAEAIAAYLYLPEKVDTYVGSAHKIVLASSYEFGSSYASNFNLRGQIAHDITVRYTAGIKVNLRSANDYSLAQHLGFTYQDLPSVGWEIIPFSWVFDYFTTTGDFLSDAFSSPSGATVYVSKSVRDLVTNNLSLENVPIVNGYYVRNSSGSSDNSVITGGTYTRTALGSLPHRSFRFKTADEIGVNSIKRLLNLAAILGK
jgi:hypothetical protein